MARVVIYLLEPEINALNQLAQQEFRPVCSPPQNEQTLCVVWIDHLSAWHNDLRRQQYRPAHDGIEQ